jgi:hypothetical protein
MVTAEEGGGGSGGKADREIKLGVMDSRSDQQRRQLRS